MNIKFGLLFVMLFITIVGTGANKGKDYPDLSKKPKDAAYPPFNDEISPQ